MFTQLARPKLELDAVGDPAAEILSEETFEKMLCLERKRVERSKKCFALLLIDLAKFLKFNQDYRVEWILVALLRSTRDTDIAGWHRAGDTIGVIFTEIDTSAPIVEMLSSRLRNAFLEVMNVQQFQQIRLSFHFYPDNGEARSVEGHEFSLLYPDLTRDVNSKRISLLAKRGLDVLGSSALLILLSPLILVLACVVKATSKGPIIFRQKRLGQFGEQFTFLKFRSMYAETDHSIHREFVTNFIARRAEGGEQQPCKIVADPRITKVGGFLRRTSLDELPQLFNVLIGQMSLVGPRPPLPYEFEKYEVWHKRRLLEVKPGITGLWQVEGRSRVAFDDMVRMDLQYARAWSLWLDIKILLQTPKAVLSGNGAR